MIALALFVSCIIVSSHIIDSNGGMDNHDLDSNTVARRSRQQFCPHCEEMVSNSTYYRHRAEHFDEVSKRWNIGTYSYSTIPMHINYVCYSSASLGLPLIFLPVMITYYQIIHAYSAAQLQICSCRRQATYIAIGYSHNYSYVVIASSGNLIFYMQHPNRY